MTCVAGDAALGHILANIADAARFICCLPATHGMGRHYNAVDMLPETVLPLTASSGTDHRKYADVGTPTARDGQPRTRRSGRGVLQFLTTALRLFG